jgi:hypothetical protein
VFLLKKVGSKYFYFECILCVVSVRDLALNVPALLHYCLTLYPVAVTDVYRPTVWSAVIITTIIIIIIIIVICDSHIRE